MNRRTDTIAMLLPLVIMAGCTAGPDFQPPAAPAVTAYTAPDTGKMPVAGRQALMDQDLPAEWWSLFGSAPLNALIRQALANNPDLQSGQAALRVAMENMKAEQGSYYPVIAASLAGSRNRDARQLSPVLASSQLLYNLYQTQLSVSWTPDLWGGTQRRVEGLQAAADAQRFQLQSVQLTLTGNIVAAAIGEALLREQIAVTENLIAGQRKILEIQRRQVALGQIAAGDTAAQETLIAQSQQLLPALRKQLEQQRDLLAALAGRTPADDVPQTFALSALTLPAALPVSLPSRLVRHRPDIRVAEEMMHAANADVGVSEADMLPNITLSASAGTAATQLGGAFSSGNGLWNLGAGLTQPLFDGGILKHRNLAAKAAYDQAAAQYRGTVIAAFQDVADVLHAIQDDADALAAAQTAEAAAAHGLSIARKQVSLGQSSPLTVLTAEQAEFQTQLSVIQARAASLSDTAALFVALGGSWWREGEIQKISEEMH